MQSVGWSSIDNMYTNKHNFLNQPQLKLWNFSMRSTCFLLNNVLLSQKLTDITVSQPTQTANESGHFGSTEVFGE